VADPDPPQPDAEELVRFVRMACHGLRNPLAIATGMLELLGELSSHQLDEESRELLARSAAAVRRTADMVLSVQRYVGAQHRPLQPVPVDLGAAVAGVADGLDPDEVVVRVDGALPTLEADQHMVDWVLHELIENARRHADVAGPVTVVVAAEAAEGRCLVSVTDDGGGIPAERLEEAFGDGERLERVGGGLGLGLPIVRTVLVRHGGAAWLEPAPSGSGLRAVLAWPT
jgi:signal transduction histidine kinase